MAQALRLAGTCVDPGTTCSMWVPVARTCSGSMIAIPVVVVHGSQEGPVVLVDAATHGDESEGTLALLRLIRELTPVVLRGTLICVPALNGPALDAEARGNPLERHYYDMDGAFPGEPGGSITQRVANRYFTDLVACADVVVSLHGGGGMFYLGGYVIARSPTGDDLDLIRAMGWKRFSRVPDTSLGSQQLGLVRQCSERGIAVIIAEMGGAGYRSPVLLERTVGEFQRGLRNLMIHYGLISGHRDVPRTLWSIKKQNIRVDSGGVIELGKGIDIDMPVSEGQELMRVCDVFGHVLEEIRAPFAGRLIGLPASPLAYPGRIVASVYQVIEEVSSESDSVFGFDDLEAQSALTERDQHKRLRLGRSRQD